MFKLTKLVTKKNYCSFQKPKNFLGDPNNFKRKQITRNFHVSPCKQNFIQISVSLKKIKTKEKPRDISLNTEKMINLFKNDPNKWVESPNGLAYAEELINAQAIDLGSNVFEFKLKNHLQYEIESPSLFVRKSQREIWEDVYDSTKNCLKKNALVFFIGN
jgi:hypothetical protein